MNPTIPTAMFTAMFAASVKALESPSPTPFQLRMVGLVSSCQDRQDRAQLARHRRAKRAA